MDAANWNQTIFVTLSFLHVRLSKVYYYGGQEKSVDTETAEKPTKAIIHGDTQKDAQSAENENGNENENENERKRNNRGEEKSEKKPRQTLCRGAPGIVGTPGATRTTSVFRTVSLRTSHHFFPGSGTA